MKFGFNQANKPTPHRISLLCDFLASIFGIVAGFITTAEFVSYSVSDVVAPILTALMIPITLTFKRMFGEEVKEKEIPVGQVSEIKEDKKEP